MSSLPETLKEDLDQLDKLEGKYRVTAFLTEDLEDLSPGNEPPCGSCNAKNQMKHWKEVVEQYKPMITWSKVFLNYLSQIVRSIIVVVQGRCGVCLVQEGGQVERVH